MTLPYVLRKGAINEPLFLGLGPQASIYNRLGIVPQRTGNAAPLAAPRNANLASDGRWLGCRGQPRVGRRIPALLDLRVDDEAAEQIDERIAPAGDVVRVAEVLEDLRKGSVEGAAE